VDEGGNEVERGCGERRREGGWESVRAKER